MLGVLKWVPEASARAEIPKLVTTYWPLLNQGGDLALTRVNVSLVLHNKLESPSDVTQIFIAYKGGVRITRVRPITSTLFDNNNPITVSYSGKYKKSSIGSMLHYYDGVDGVFVDTGANIWHSLDSSARIEFILVKFSSPLKPGQKCAIRFVFDSSNGFADSGDGTLFFSHNGFLQSSELHRFAPIPQINKLLIPCLLHFDKDRNGGFDIFYHIPLSYSVSDINFDQGRQGIIKYDCFGSPLQRGGYRRIVVPSMSLFGSNASALNDEAQFNMDVNIFSAFSKRKGDTMPITNNGGIIMLGNSSISGGATINNDDVLLSKSKSDVAAFCDELVKRLTEAGAGPTRLEEIKSSARSLESAAQREDKTAWIDSGDKLIGLLREIGGLGADIYEYVSAFVNTN